MSRQSVGKSSSRFFAMRPRCILSALYVHMDGMTEEIERDKDILLEPALPLALA